MSLALVDDRKGNWTQKSAPVTRHGMYFHSAPLSSQLSLLLPEKDRVGWC